MPIEEFEEIRVIKEDGFRGITKPVMVVLRGTDPQSTAQFNHVAFTADRDYEYVRIRERHGNAASDGSVDVQTLANGAGAGSGTSILKSEIDMTTSSDTLQEADIDDDKRLLLKDESVYIEAHGTLSSLQNVAIDILLRAL